MPDDRIVRVFLVDDHEVVRRGVAELLAGEDDIDVIGEAGTAADAVARIPAASPDVAVLDVRLPDGSGVEVCREIRSANESVKCLMLTSYADDEALFDAIMAGASGYVLKAIRGEELLSAVRDVADGKSLLDPAATARVLERLRDPKGGGRDSDQLSELTDQERRILALIGEGMTNRAIGEQLHLAEKTIKNYVSSLLSKLGMQRRSQAAAFVARMDAGKRPTADAPEPPASGGRQSGTSGPGAASSGTPAAGAGQPGAGATGPGAGSGQGAPGPVPPGSGSQQGQGQGPGPVSPNPASPPVGGSPAPGSPAPGSPAPGAGPGSDGSR